MIRISTKILLCILVCVVLLWSLAGAQGRRTYEIRPQIPESVFQNESTKTLNAYERVIDRALELNGRQLDAMALNIKDISKQLDRVETKLDRLLNHMYFIESALGIPQLEVQEKPLDTRPKDPNTPDKEK